MPPSEHNPWIGRAVRFGFGAAFGVLVSLDWSPEDLRAVIAIVLVTGTLAMVFGDEFWEHIEW